MKAVSMAVTIIFIFVSPLPHLLIPLFHNDYEISLVQLIQCTNHSRWNCVWSLYLAREKRTVSKRSS